ncbi:hypothetical protein SUGI_0504460 [Cryptomeria japonica]|nr:hypothetical protein SUGI_0504460 [Cryptomeria japonica]
MSNLRSEANLEIKICHAAAKHEQMHVDTNVVRKLIPTERCGLDNKEDTKKTVFLMIQVWPGSNKPQLDKLCQLPQQLLCHLFIGFNVNGWDPKFEFNSRTKDEAFHHGYVITKSWDSASIAENLQRTTPK